MPSATRRVAPRDGSRRGLPADERRAAIIDAVVPLLREYGEAVTCRQIADAAGIAEGTIFRVFADKDELLARRVRAAVDLAPARSIDPQDRHRRSRSKSA